MLAGLPLLLDSCSNRDRRLLTAAICEDSTEDSLSMIPHLSARVFRNR